MKVCIPCAEPGGPDAAIGPAFESSDMLDYYEVREDGGFEHTAQMRNCGGAMCVDPVDAITHRGAEAVVVAGISPSHLMRLRTAGVRVLRSVDRPAREVLADLAAGRLSELTPSDLKGPKG